MCVRVRCCFPLLEVALSEARVYIHARLSICTIVELKDAMIKTLEVLIHAMTYQDEPSSNVLSALQCVSVSGCRFRGQGERGSVRN